MIEIRDDSGQARYEILVDGELAGFADYTLRPGVISFTHTEVSPPFGGRGLAGELIGFALEDARARGLDVLPFCPFVRRFIANNHEYLDLVPADQRDRFDL
ncbi:GNAT family N-acetyltransferase [Longispora sp. K20-0274]|uniref:GNAT family N-acetyltransferase n=1 Tax=Longispora sp. K20-0274 TaxID=3088255 RepID=UPI003999E881